MPGMARRPLIDWTDDEVKAAIRAEAEHVRYSYNAMVAELDRRATNRQARETRILSVVSIVIAVVALVISALR